ncbi:hypothetical protein ACO2Q1_01680 [Brevundimonas sp. VNH65]|uniref:hypothetical protein n=1 Tax=Brevundimonas sp. VNH65 TaxID=3400917 RepID=UPI003C09C0D7
MRTVLAVATTLGLAATWAGQASAQARVRPINDRIVEVFRPTVDHSGNRALGVVVRQETIPNFAAVTIRLPRPIDAQVCMTVTSVDGRYTANATYRVKTSDRTAILEFPTGKLGREARYDGVDLAVSARVGSCQTTAPVLVATWTSASPTADVGFAVNAGNGASAFMIEPGRGRVACDSLLRSRPGRASAAMTHICWVSSARLGDNRDIRVFRETPAGRDTEIVFPLYGAAPRR